jgi:uncharacterized coiled-coil protein SlyX
VEEEIISLETRIAYYEKTVEELSAVIYRQEKEFRLLKQQVRQIEGMIKNSGNFLIKDLKDETLPPHY